MVSLVQKFNQSLRLRLIIFIVLISTIVLVAGEWIVNQQIHQRLDANIESDATLVSRFINHTAMVTMDSKVLQHLLMEVYKETSRIKLMLVAENSNDTIIASTIPDWIGLQVKELPDEHLRDEISQSLIAGSFTQHVESEDSDLTIITALDQHLSSHSGYSEDNKQAQTDQLHNEQIHAENEIDKNSIFLDQLDNLSAYTGSSSRPLPTPRDSSRGSIVVVFDRNLPKKGSINPYLLQGGTIAALILILAIVIYFRVASQVLKPVEKLIAAMREQKDGGRDASEFMVNSDEIGDLAENFNSIISISQEENTRLKKNMADIIHQEFDRWHLTKTEKEIALLLIKGRSMQEIGEIRNVKEKSVRQQATGIYTKARVSNRYELTSYFIEDLLKPQIP